MSRQTGFTLIELMIVVAIIAILAAIAIPAYQDFAIRAKLTEGYSQAMAARNAVGSAWNAGGMTAISGVAQYFGSNNSSTSSKYIEYVQVANSGVITVVVEANSGNGIPADLDGLTFTLTPQVETGSGYQLLAANLRGALDWACASASHVTADARGMLFSSASLPAKYMPSECR